MERPRPLIELGPVPPWVGRVTVTPLTLNGYEGTQFDVIASWAGPPLPGTPTPRPGQIVSASDSFIEPDLERARAIAQHALEDLRAGSVPDLRAIARGLK